MVIYSNILQFKLFKYNIILILYLNMSINKKAIKEINKIKDYWNNRPCNLNHSKLEKGTKEYFDEVEKKKHFVEPHILDFADFKNCNNIMEQMKIYL